MRPLDVSDASSQRETRSEGADIISRVRVYVYLRGIHINRSIGLVIVVYYYIRVRDGGVTIK